MSNKKLKLAVLIDADNTSYEIIPFLLKEFAKYGSLNSKKAYGNWKKPALKNWEDVFIPNAITPIHIIDYTKRKNSSDIGLVIDAMDLLYSKNFDGFCLVSSDSDFTRLAIRIRESGLLVYGFGEQKTPESFREACDKFIYVENLLLDEDDSLIDEQIQSQQTSIIKKNTPSKKTAKQLISDGNLVRLIRAAITEHADDEGDAFLGPVGRYINNIKPDFDSRNYGYKKLSELIFEMQELFHFDKKTKPYKVSIKK